MVPPFNLEASDIVALQTAVDNLPAVLAGVLGAGTLAAFEEIYEPDARSRRRAAAPR